MKAFLLAAGLGTRLRPLTDHTPKCLLPIGGRPLLSYWFQLLKGHGVTEVLVNVHHRAADVEGYLEAEPPPVPVRLFHEPTLLGSAGTVKANAAWVAAERDFLVAYADNLTDVDLTSLVDAHRHGPFDLTVGLFRTDRPSECGIATLDERGTIVDFCEKPAEPPSNLANAGIYVASPALLDVIPDTRPADFGFDVLPRLIGRMQGVPLDGFLLDVGTHERYERAQQAVGRLVFPA